MRNSLVGCWADGPGWGSGSELSGAQRFVESWRMELTPVGESWIVADFRDHISRLGGWEVEQVFRVFCMDRFSVVPAAYVIVRRGDEVLLLLRANTGYMDGHWAVPAGHVERGESAVAAAVRELREEVGLVVDPADLVPVTAMHRTGGNGDPIDERVDFFFTTSKWEGEPSIKEPEKAGGLEWYPLDKLPDPLVPHEARVLASLTTEPLPPVVVQGFA